MEPFNLDPEMATLIPTLSEEDLLNLALAHEELSNDSAIELFICCCLSLFKLTGSLHHLQRGEQQAEGWVAITDPSHPQRSHRLEILTTMRIAGLEEGWPEGEIYPGYWPMSVFEDLHEKTLRLAAEGMERVMLGKLARSSRLPGKSILVDFAITHAELFRRTRNPDEIDRGSRILEQIAQKALDDLQMVAQCFRRRFQLVKIRFEFTRRLEDLNLAISLAEMAESFCPSTDDSSDKDSGDFLHGLSLFYMTRFRQTKQTADLDLSISTAETAVKHLKSNSDDPLSCLGSLAKAI
jgi:hypothetical protein